MTPRSMIPLHRPWMGPEEESAVLEVLRSRRLAGNGPQCAALERDLQHRLGGTGAVLALASGTHALELSMRLLDVRGGEVIVPSFTFPSVANAVLNAGGSIRFCEVREPDLNVDLDHARTLVGPSTCALVVTHYAGHPQDIEGFPVPVIEDATHALGSSIGGRACGTSGVFGCFSFHATKSFVAGEGGALVTADPEAAWRARIFREKGTNRDEFNAGRVDEYCWVGPGSSMVMPELSASIARAQLARFDRVLGARRRIADRYDQSVADLEREGRLSVVRPVHPLSSHHIYAVLVNAGARRAIVRRMAARGVQAASHFVPLHSSPYGRTIAGGPPLPTTDRVGASILRLPIYPELSDDDVARVVDALRDALSDGASH